MAVPPVVLYDTVTTSVVGADRETGAGSVDDHEPMRAVDFSLAGTVVDQEGIGIVLHGLDGVAVAEAADPGAVCERDRDGARDLRGGSGVAALLRGQRARVDAGAIGHAGGCVAESERVGSEESGGDVKVEAAAHFAKGAERAFSEEPPQMTNDE